MEAGNGYAQFVKEHMVKHPQTRAERLRIKQFARANKRDKFEEGFKTKVKPDKVRRNILKAQIKDQEASDELRGYRANLGDALAEQHPGSNQGILAP